MYVCMYVCIYVCMYVLSFHNIYSLILLSIYASRFYQQKSIHENLYPMMFYHQGALFL